MANRALRLLSEWAFATLGLSVIRLWTHADDQRRTVKGQVWNTVGYLRGAPDPASRHPPATP